MSEATQGTPAPQAEATAQAPVDEKATTAAPAEEEVADDLSDVAKDEPTKEEIKAAKKKLSVKVRDKMREVEFDPNNEDEVKRYISKAMAADDTFQEAAALKKALVDLIQEIKTNPRSVLSHEAIGLDLKELAQQILNEEIEDSKKTPEQKKIEELEKALKAKEERERKLEEERMNAERAKMDQEALEALDNQVSEALSKSELPKSPYIVMRIANAMEQAINLGFTDVTVEQIIPFVENQITSELNRLFEEAPEETATKLMERLIGKKSLDRYRKVKVAKARKPTDMPQKIEKTEASSGNKTDDKPVKKERFKDFFKPF